MYTGERFIFTGEANVPIPSGVALTVASFQASCDGFYVLNGSAGVNLLAASGEYFILTTVNGELANTCAFVGPIVGAKADSIACVSGAFQLKAGDVVNLTLTHNAGVELTTTICALSAFRLCCCC